MKIIIFPRAKKELKRLPKFIQIIVAKKIRSIQEWEPDELRNFEKLVGYKNIFRIRLGDYRLVYKLAQKKIWIISISHRKEVYQKLKQLLGR